MSLEVGGLAKASCPFRGDFQLAYRMVPVITKHLTAILDNRNLKFLTCCEVDRVAVCEVMGDNLLVIRRRRWVLHQISHIDEEDSISQTHHLFLFKFV